MEGVFCLRVCVLRTCSTQGSQKKTSYTPELKLQMVVLGAKPGSFAKATSALNI